MQGLYLGGYAKAAIHGTGGELRVHGQGDIIDCVTRDRFVRFDGRFAHELLSFGAQVRYGACAPYLACAPKARG